MAAHTFTLLGSDSQKLHDHLFPGDGKEAVAIGLCTLSCSENPVRILLKEIIPVPHDVCTMRSRVTVQWPFDWLDPIIKRAKDENLSIVKFHSHPDEIDEFSEMDDVSDSSLFDAISSYTDLDIPNASIIMLESGRMVGRIILSNNEFHTLSKISILDRMPVFWAEKNDLTPKSSIGRNTKGFGAEMRQELHNLSVAVIGVSGTGSIVAEQLARLGVGRIILIDPDKIKEKNLDRILNANMSHARGEKYKVDVIKSSLDALESGTEIVAYNKQLTDISALKAAASCDFLFGCVDGAEGRSIMDRLASSQLQILIDVGVGIEATEDGSVDQVDAAIHYIVPGGSSLLSRGVYTPEQVHAEKMKRVAPAEYEEQKKQKYIKGRDEEQPAVISLNMVASSNAVLEWLSRLYPFKNELNHNKFDTVRINLAESCISTNEERTPCPVMRKLLASGDRNPLLNLPELTVRKK